MADPLFRVIMLVPMGGRFVNKLRQTVTVSDDELRSNEHPDFAEIGTENTTIGDVFEIVAGCMDDPELVRVTVERMPTDD